MERVHVICLGARRPAIVPEGCRCVVVESLPGRRPVPVGVRRALLLIGDAALAGIQPEELRVALSDGCSYLVLLCPSIEGVEELPRWFAHGFTRVVAPAHYVVRVADGVRRLQGDSVAESTVLAGWWPGSLPPAGPALQALLALESRSSPLTATDWASALRWSDSRLRRACIDGLGLSPKRVLLARVAILARRDRERRIPRRTTANALGYVGSSTLARAERAGLSALSQLEARRVTSAAASR